MSGSRADLPPPPGTEGTPRPPRAPRVAGTWPTSRISEIGHLDPTGPDRRSLVSVEDEPILEWIAVWTDRTWKRSLLGAAATVAPIAVVLAVGAFVFASDQLGLTLTVIAAVVAVAVAGIAAWNRWRDTPLLLLNVGSRHIEELEEYGARTTLDLYALDSVTVDDRRDGMVLLRMTAAGHRDLHVPLAAVETSPALWDLVHNGLRHSVARGARIDDDTRRRLHITTGPETR